MENPDASPDIRIFRPPLLLAAALWDGAVRPRAGSLTPLYITRYAGVRGRPPLSAHDFWELLYSFGDAGTLLTSKGDLDLARGDAVLIPPGLGHIEVTREPGAVWDVLWIGLAGSELAGWDATTGAQRHPCPGLEPWVDALWHYSRLQPGAIGPELDALLRFLVLAIQRQARSGPQPEGDWLQRVLSHIHAHLADDLQVADLARLAGFSHGHFQRCFKEAVGETPMAYLTRRRLETAATYLTQSSHTVAQIAELVGYRDPLYFSKVCRRHFGRPPSALRTGPTFPG